jgi:hypothetical protein
VPNYLTDPGILYVKPQFAEHVTTKPAPVPFSKTLDLLPGKHTIYFTSDAPKVAPQDPAIPCPQSDAFQLRVAGKLV